MTCMKKNYLFFVFSLFMIFSFVFDKQIMSFFQSLRFIYLDYLMFGFSSIVLVVATGILYCSMISKKKPMLYFLLGTGVSYVISYLLKLLVKIPRPLGSIEMGFGFPSSHATVYFFMACFMSDRFDKYKYYFITLACLVSISRIYLGVHNIGDVIGGGLLGIGLYLISRKWLKV